MNSKAEEVRELEVAASQARHPEDRRRREAALADAKAELQELSLGVAEAKMVEMQAIEEQLGDGDGVTDAERVELEMALDASQAEFEAVSFDASRAQAAKVAALERAVADAPDGHSRDAAAEELQEARRVQLTLLAAGAAGKERAIEEKQAQLARASPGERQALAQELQAAQRDLGQTSVDAAQVKAAGTVTARFYADNVLRHTQTVTNENPFRLPAGFLANEWQFELEGTAEVFSLAVAETMRELKGA